MALKVEKLEVWHLALEFVDLMYGLADRLPDHERFNLASQIRRAGTSVALNIAEGSMGQTDREQSRFLGIAVRSVVETVACNHLIRRRAYLQETKQLDDAYAAAETPIRKLQSFRKRIAPDRPWAKEDEASYGDDTHDH